MPVVVRCEWGWRGNVVRKNDQGVATWFKGLVAARSRRFFQAMRVGGAMGKWKPLSVASAQLHQLEWCNNTLASLDQSLH
jgi:hypothetical protein